MTSGSCPAAAPTAHRSVRPAQGSSTACSAAAAARREGRLYHHKLCIRCTVTDRVTALLDNGTGHIDPALAPLAAALSTGPTPTPAGRLVWLSKPRNRALLRALATQTLPLTHDGLTDYPDQAGIPYLRALLVHCAALPRSTGNCSTSKPG